MLFYTEENYLSYLLKRAVNQFTEKMRHSKEDVNHGGINKPYSVS